MGYTISRVFHFSAAHRISGHPKCGRLHGHNYRVEVFVSNEVLDPATGMVIDFADLDKLCSSLFGEMDHRFLNPRYDSDPLCNHLSQAEVTNLPLQTTTVEELAAYIWNDVQESLVAFQVEHQLPGSLICAMVKVQETERNVALYQPSVNSRPFVHLTERDDAA